MKPDKLEQFLSLHQSIVKEREALLGRLKHANEALAAMGVNSTVLYYGQTTPTGRARNTLSLKETILQVLEGRAMTREEILDAVLRTGYQFATDDPLNSIGVVIYGKNPRFKNIGGRFSI